MMRRSPVAALALLFSLASTATALESAVVRPNPAVPGDIVVIQPSHLPSRATFSLTVLRFDWRDGKPRALAGIDVDSGPGQRDVLLRWTYAPPVETHLVVREKKFPVEHVTGPVAAGEVPNDAKDRVWTERQHLAMLFRDVSRQSRWSGPFRQPVDGTVAVPFGLRRIVDGKMGSPFPAVELRAAAGTPVRAANGGQVVLARDLYDTGKTVILDHGLGLYTIYGQLQDIAVREGARLQRGDTVGRVGSSGHASEPSLYWAARLLQARVDPFQLLELEGGGQRDGGSAGAQSRD